MSKKKVSALDMPDVPMGQLPEHLNLQRTRLRCKADAPIHTESIQYSGAYASMGVDSSVDIKKFNSNFKVEIVRLTEDEIEFDMIGIDAALANAFRRILIAEVPTMAIKKILMVNNTSVIPDEVLAHRLGLIPLDADPRVFEYLSVKSDQLKWLPNGSELEIATLDKSSKVKSYTSFSCSQNSLPEISKKPLGVKHDDIILAQLGPGQEIELEAHAVKGIGKDHAKWSPVAATWYRMLPEVVLSEEVKGQDAEKLVKKCPVNVFDIEDLGNGDKKAVVANSRACTLCGECIRDVSEGLVKLRHVEDHFIFTIESVGALSPDELFIEAVKILEEKCHRQIVQLS
ncbi:DNA-directed RNA polymerases I and III subunit RPAC1-like isoform X2 [Zingiber officinale]|uniref:DNA-directed RNA polymerase RpoA/D/Rpb3-type domain-containing protein n=1 Tax=Zingiber officinale TaxID=94328 RepID=A0A8J5H288_ZINOF|nr:DNA-directed RNA polymerases I and III subunit RPAC1-like isoform X2 [Zingiber officinale]KAG6516998.1 hypothetical protein ZIOFF_020375 [Zingiber officinale]